MVALLCGIAESEFYVFLRGYVLDSVGVKRM